MFCIKSFFRNFEYQKSTLAIHAVIWVVKKMNIDWQVLKTVNSCKIISQHYMPR